MLSNFISLFKPKLVANIRMSSPAVKKICTEADGDKLKIGTHDGTFHCDESLGCYLIKQLDAFKNAVVYRSRKAEILDSCDIVLDVGSVYDHSRKRYDHHQNTFALTLSSIYPDKKFGNVKLSSAGLVYAHYGHEIIANKLGWSKDDSKTNVVFDKVYEFFIKEIDAIDNGINMCDGEARYQIHTHLSARVSNLLPAWNEERTDDMLYARFLKAIQLTGTEFEDKVDYFGRSWMQARSIVEQDFSKRFENDAEGRIIVLHSFAPWTQHLFELEKENNVVGQIRFIIFRDTLSNNYRVRAVPVSPESFELRTPLHESWRGLKDEALSSLSGIDNCVFVHSTGFIGGNATLEGALQMARKSLV